MAAVREARESLDILKTHLCGQLEDSVDQYIESLETAIELTGQLEGFLEIHCERSGLEQVPKECRK